MIIAARARKGLPTALGGSTVSTRAGSSAPALLSCPGMGTRHSQPALGPHHLAHHRIRPRESGNRSRCTERADIAARDGACNMWSTRVSAPGLLVSGLRRVGLDLFEKLTATEYAAFSGDPVVTPLELPTKARHPQAEPVGG